MFKPGEMILYHMPNGAEARPFLVIRSWPNEYGPGKHGYNGILFLDGQNDAREELNPPGRSAIHRYDRLPFAHGYSVPEGMEPGMVSATPNHAEETAALPPMVNISGWGQVVSDAPRLVVAKVGGPPPTPEEAKIIEDTVQARLKQMGVRTNGLTNP